MGGSIRTIESLRGWRCLALDDVGSTNAEALCLAAGGDPGRLWVTARRQLAGRGRRGRPWVSEAGNLYASLLLVDPATPKDLGTLPLVAALGVYRALKPFFSRTPQALAIKWPNDILVDEAKVSGILLESAATAEGRQAVVIGCGINCAHHPRDTLYPATDLAACGLDVPPDRMFEALAGAMAGTLAQWDGGRGFAGIRDAWLMAARGVGGEVTVNLPDGSLAGIFENIDGEGYLSLRKRDGSRLRISAGDLFLGNRSGDEPRNAYG